MKENKNRQTTPLYAPRFEHDACGIGAVVDIGGRRSHETVDKALQIVEKLEHRAGKDAAGETGDGVGLLMQIPHRLMKRAAAQAEISLGEARDYGVGMFFFPLDPLKRAQAKKMLEIIANKEGLTFLGWRDVPVHPEVLGERAFEDYDGYGARASTLRPTLERRFILGFDLGEELGKQKILLDLLDGYGSFNA